MRLLTPEEAAIFLGGLNPKTVVKWARSSYLPGIPLGEGKRRRIWRFAENELSKWLVAQQNGGPHPRG